MLKLVDITKIYGIKDNQTTVLKKINLEFPNTGFVSILGPSGSGKTTLLNIIGGLDKYDSGDLLIDDISTKDYKSADFDNYRNKKIGFVFQNYQLISHLSVFKNVELSLTLGGVTKAISRKLTIKAIDDVALGFHINKKPTQLSGGQQQRVAIARALINNPDIILADEPTGALDSESSGQIMKILEEIAKTKLVIMVTHNPILAQEYSDRIIEMLDGSIVSDKVITTLEDASNSFDLSPKKSKMSFFTALGLSFNNIKTKLVRTLITAIAGSIGIIGIALVLSISNGFNSYLDGLQKELLSNSPIDITREVQIYDKPSNLGEFLFNTNDENPFPNGDEVFPRISESTLQTHVNDINQNYLDYLEGLDETLYHSVYNTYSIQTNIYGSRYGSNVPNYSGLASEFRSSLEFYGEQYDILEGRLPEANTFEAVIIVDKYNRISVNILQTLGLYSRSIINGKIVYENISGLEKITFSDLMTIKLKWIKNDDLYQLLPPGDHFSQKNINSVYNESQTIEIVGVLRNKKNITNPISSSGIAYPMDITNLIFENAKDSQIVHFMLNNPHINPMNGSSLSDTEYNNLLAQYGGIKIPTRIRIYPVSYEARDLIIDFLSHYNDQFSVDQNGLKILLDNYENIVQDATKTLVKGITTVLLILAGVSLVVSSIMIAIITYISVIERTKEIGILRSLGARRVDILMVFIAETAIIGFISGVLGVIVSLAISPIFSKMIEKMSTLSGICKPSFLNAIILIAISVASTILAGFIPSIIASIKHPVEALRGEK
ncbi:MAG: ATP-binding cassette domain-containing protein [Acholeplasmatales bacterium]|jgi:putative ABC transport system permease protein|nr:ATP-binding cassette domain-containing protein [Acholeplasmatales bacterium]